MIRAPLPPIGPTGQQPLPDNWEETINKIDRDYGKWTREAAQRNGIPPELLARLLFKESNYNKNAKSRFGAKGIAQLTPAAIEALYPKGQNKFDYFDPKSSIDAGAAYLALQYRQFRDWPKAVAAYNAGANSIRGWLNGSRSSPPSQETKTYLQYIFRGNPKAFDEK